MQIFAAHSEKRKKQSLQFEQRAPSRSPKLPESGRASSWTAGPPTPEAGALGAKSLAASARGVAPSIRGGRGVAVGGLGKLRVLVRPLQKASGNPKEIQRGSLRISWRAIRKSQKNDKEFPKVP